MHEEEVANFYFGRLIHAERNQDWVVSKP
jgi:hypothetical protein